MNIKTYNEATFDNGWNPAAVRETLLGAEHIVVVAHQNADGDAVGSLTAMYVLLRNATTKEPVVMLPDGCPDDMVWLPHTDRILSGKSDQQACAEAAKEADLVVALDLNTLDRTGVLADILRHSPAPRMLVDHHTNPDTDAFSLLVSEPEISSTCELVYWMMHSAFGNDIFDRDAATCLYTGINTDTGSFSYSNDRPSLYLAAAHLLAFGIDPMDINRRIHNTFSVQRMQFFGFAVSQRLEVFPDQGVFLITLPASDLAAYQVESHDASGLINEAMRLRDSDCGILVREEPRAPGDREPTVRISFRSKERYDVAQLASSLFGGGGHKRAAGATSHRSLDETVATIKRRLMLALAPLLLFAVLACNNVPVVDIQQPKGDTLRESIIKANRYIAGIEATQIDGYLARRNWEAVRLDGGVRLHPTSNGNGQRIAYGDTLHIGYCVETIGGDTLYPHREDTVVVGRLQPTRGLDAALRSMNHRAEACVIVPSEQAHGVVGDGDRIGSRTVLVYKLKINN